MARQTRNSKRSKPGMTIDGSATEKSKMASGDDPKAADDAKATSSATKATPATTPPATAGSTPSPKASSGTPTADGARADASRSDASKANVSKGDVSKTGASTGETSKTEASKTEASKTATSGTASARATSTASSVPASAAPKATDAKTTEKVSGNTAASTDTKAEAIKKDNREAVAAASKNAPEPAKDPAKGGAGATGPGTDAPKVTGSSSGAAGGASGGGAAASGSRPATASNDNKSSGLIPGLIGGAVALAGAWVLSLLGLFGGDDTDALRAELAEVRASIPAQAEAVDPATVVALDERVAQIEALEGERADAGVLPPEVAERIDRIEAALGDARGTEPADLSTLENRLAALEAIGPSESGDNVEALEQRFAQIETTLGAGDIEAREALGSLQARLDELAQGQEATLAETATTVAGTVAALATVRDSIDNLRSDVEALNQAVVTADETAGGRFTDIDANLGTVTNRIETLRTQIANLERGGEERGERLTGVAATLETATTRLDDVAGRVDDLSGRTEEVAARVDTNASQLADLSATVEESRSDTTVARAIAASNLKSAIDRGTSFAPELESFAAVAAEPGEIEPLREFAGRGVPTLPDLVERFDTAAADIVATQYAVGDDAGVADQLGASIRSVFQVRPVGEAASGNEVGAIVTRMEEALESGDLQAVIAEGEQLPPEALAEAEPFLADVGARLAANQLIDTALSRAIRPAG